MLAFSFAACGVDQENSAFEYPPSEQLFCRQFPVYSQGAPVSVLAMAQPTSLVTGAAGFSGAWLVHELLKAGHRVFGLDRASALAATQRRAHLHALGFDEANPQLTYIAGDLNEAASLKPLKELKVDFLFHTASLYDYSADAATLTRINVGGTENLLSLALEMRPKHFIHWSTCGVFGKPIASGRGANLPFSEKSSSPKNSTGTEPNGTHLVNAYSVSKWHQEQLLWHAHRTQSLPLTVIRPAPIYGPGSDYGHGGIAAAIGNGLLPAIPEDSKNYITASVHVHDLARFALFVAGRKDYIGEDFNVTDNSVISYHEFLHYIALLTGRNMIDIPLLPVGWLKPVASLVAHGWTALEKNFGVPRVRILEVQSAEYISSSYWISNRKSLTTGFTYLYPDVKEGLKDTVAWLRETGAIL